MASRKLPKRLFKNKEVVHTYQHDRENKVDMKSMSRDHLDVLQNIEFTLVNHAREEPRSMIGSSMRRLRWPSGVPNPARIPRNSSSSSWRCCEAMRDFRSDVPDNIWQGGLKTVRDSVRRHSTLSPGEKAYIRFVEKYIK